MVTKAGVITGCASVAYTLTGQKRTLTAKELRAQLKAIETTYEIDWDDGNLLFSLLASFKIIDGSTAGSGGVLGTTLLSRWQDAETAVRSAYNAAKYTFDIPGMSSRMVDGFNKSKGIIFEVKYGAASLSQFIQTEIVRDVWLMQNSPMVKSVEWHFYQSITTGQGDPSGPLLAELLKNGIKVIFH